MKKRLLGAAVLAMVLLLPACGNTAETEIQTETSGVQMSAATVATVPSLYSPYSAEEFRGKNMEEAEKCLRDAGFQTIESHAVEDITSRDPIPDGSIESVEVDGRTDFDPSTPFEEDAKVVITFHRIPKLKPPVSPEEAAAFGYLDVGERYFRAGFANVHTDEVYDLEPGTNPGLK